MFPIGCVQTLMQFSNNLLLFVIQQRIIEKGSWEINAVEQTVSVYQSELVFPWAVISSSKFLLAIVPDNITFKVKITIILSNSVFFVLHSYLFGQPWYHTYRNAQLAKITSKIRLFHQIQYFVLQVYLISMNCLNIKMTNIQLQLAKINSKMQHILEFNIYVLYS